jgi:hypothetical protein
MFAKLRAIYNPDYLTLAAMQLRQARVNLLDAQARHSMAELSVNYYKLLIERHEQLLSQSNSTTSQGQFSTEEPKMKK